MPLDAPRTPAASRRGPAPPPGLLPLAVRLFGPTLLLAGLAAFALVRDWRSAQADAIARANELATHAADDVAALLQPLPWKDRSVAGFGVGQDFDGFEVGPSNELLHPAPGGWPPRPVPLLDDLAPEPRAVWVSARRAFDEGRWEAALADYDRLLGPDSDAPEPTITPSPVAAGWSPRHRANALYERALTLQRMGRTAGLLEAFARAFGPLDTAGIGIDATTEAGLAVRHLAALRILDLAGGRVDTLPGDWRRDPLHLARLSESSSSPFVTEFLERLQPFLPDLLAASDRAGLTAADFEGIHRRAERSRLHHAVALRGQPAGVPWPAAFWIDPTSPGWLAVEQGPVSGPPEPAHSAPRRYVLLHESRMRDALQAAARDLDPRGDFVLRLGIAGRHPCVPARAEAVDREASTDPARGELATLYRTTRGGAVFAVGLSLGDPSAYFASQRRRVLLFGALLLAALVAAAVAVRATHQSLLRQHELNLEKSNFVASVSHELRAPLGSIRLLAEGLERGTVPDEARRLEYFRLIGQETRRLGTLVENVLDFSRIEQGRKRYEFEPTDITALVQGSVGVFAPLAAERRVTVDLRIPADAACIEMEAEGHALRQALLNLLDNALKHSTAGSSIRVELVREAPGAVRISVADSGPGIPTADHARIFEPFYRRGSELRRETQGVGIGLSIVRHILEAHGGRVELASEPGQGATFTLVLPAASSSSSSSPCAS